MAAAARPPEPGLTAPPTLTSFLLIDSLLAGRLDVFRDALRHLVLPAFTLSLGGLATIARFTRAGVLETLQKDFVTYERAQGFPPRALIWKFVLRNSVVAAITQIGLLFGGPSPALSSSRPSSTGPASASTRCRRSSPPTTR